jgi:hypothetical protein
MTLAFVQSSAEHLCAGKREQALFGTRLALSLTAFGLLVTGVDPKWMLLGLCLISLAMLHRFQGPYNGGSDRMGLLVLFCLTGIAFAPSLALRETLYAYLAFQLTFSYVMSGYVKLKNPEWRSGRALCDVFQFSAYPVSENLRQWADRPRLMWRMSWGVMLFELLFPLALLSPASLFAALFLAASFHLSNAFLFGLNRFFWIWLSAYPALIWLQLRLML